MQDNQENKIEFRDKLENFYSNNKAKIYIFIIALLVAVISLALINGLNKKKSIVVLMNITYICTFNKAFK